MVRSAMESATQHRGPVHKVQLLPTDYVEPKTKPKFMRLSHNGHNGLCLATSILIV
jgi:hypothetical protein